MSSRRIPVHAVAIAAALALTSLTTTASAQADRRIPTRKGDIRRPMRGDTVVIRDTVRVSDTVMVVRSDTVIREPIVPYTPLGRFYGGANLGASFPSGDFGIAQNAGFTFGVIGGWDAWTVPLGARLGISYTHFGDEDGPLCPGAVICPDIGNPQLWNIDLNGKLRFPTLMDAPFRFYTTGGVTWNSYSGATFIDDVDDVDDIGDGIIIVTDDGWHSQWGWNLGGGVDFLWGSTRLYLESRYQSASINGASGSYVPLVVGITFW